MQAAINFAETGHLCLTTLRRPDHQALRSHRNFSRKRNGRKVLMDLSFNVGHSFRSAATARGPNWTGSAVEILLNTR